MVAASVFLLSSDRMSSTGSVSVRTEPLRASWNPGSVCHPFVPSHVLFLVLGSCNEQETESDSLLRATRRRAAGFGAARRITTGSHACEHGLVVRFELHDRGTRPMTLFLLRSAPPEGALQRLDSLSCHRSSVLASFLKEWTRMQRNRRGHQVPATYTLSIPGCGRVSRCGVASPVQANSGWARDVLRKLLQGEVRRLESL